MAADNHTTIVGNLVDDPELRLPTTAPQPGPERQAERGGDFNDPAPF